MSDHARQKQLAAGLRRETRSSMNGLFAKERPRAGRVGTLFCLAALAWAAILSAALGAQTLPKAAVADKIRRVEDGVDQFRKYLETRGDNARSAAGNAQTQAQAQGRQSGKRRTATDAQKQTATAKKDDLDSALDDLNRSTNRLRRKFDATDKWMETKVEVERVMDDGRSINQAIARGNYGSEAARLWAALRNNMNDLARAYNVPPLGV